MSRTTSVSRLNPQQREAVLHPGGALLVLAGAGTGKTSVVTERIVRLLREGVPPAAILAVTFTNKAAGEMRERVAALAGGKYDLAALILSTFHSFCVRFLRAEAETLGLPAGFTICDAGDQISILRKALRHLRGAARLAPEDALREIGRLKNKGIGPAVFARQAVEEKEQTLASAYRRYQEGLRAVQALDFDDLLLRTVELLEADAVVRARWAGRFRHILVDEFQDTNGVQYRLVELLASGHGNLCVVGDDDQSIYGWRGAVAQNILGFHRKFAGAKVVALEENYRSTGAILAVANALIAKNEERHAKALWTRAGEGMRPRVWAAEDGQDEAERIVGEVKRRFSAGELRPGDVAVILRTNGQTRPLEDELRASQIPYVIIGGTSFFDRKEVKDVLAYLTVIVNPRADAALLRILNVPPRGIGEKTVETLSAHAAKAGQPLSTALAHAGGVSGLGEGPRKACAALAANLQAWRAAARSEAPAGLVGRILAETGYADEIRHLYEDPLEQASRLAMAHEVGDSLKRYLERDPREGLSGFLQEAAIAGREDETAETKKRNREALKLITIHSAKGLEFPVVYLAGLEEGLLPHKNSEAEGTTAEERRLCYVAITRARRELTLSYCRARSVRGKPAPCAPSRFLQEIPEALLDRLDKVSSAAATKSAIREWLDRKGREQAES